VSALSGDLTWGDIARWESFDDGPVDPCPDCGELENCHCYDEPPFCPHCHQEMP
jgi:hypothetical protein